MLIQCPPSGIFALRIWLCLFCLCGAITGRAQEPATVAANNSLTAAWESSAHNNIGDSNIKTSAPETNTKINLFTGLGHTESAQYRPLTAAERKKLFLNQTVLPPAYLGIIWATALDQAQHSPTQWGNGAQGFGRRLASHFGSNFVGSAILYAGTSLTGEDPRYIRSQSHTWWQRSWHALAYTVLTYDRHGKPCPAFAGIAAQYGASLITQTWMPAQSHPWQKGLRAGTMQFAFGGLNNLIEEFWPEMTRLRHHRW